MNAKQRVSSLFAAVLAIVVITVTCMPAFAQLNSKWVEIEEGSTSAKLRAFLAVPDQEQQAPAIIFLHGCSGLGPGGGVFATYTSWALHFVKLGYAVLMIDSTGSRGIATSCGDRKTRRILLRQRPP